MILRKDILEKSQQWGVPPDTVDKDYVLGHVLSGIQKQFVDQLLFKGGTCLRKCYFPDYRFSEDLDFTSRDPGFILNKTELNNILVDVKQQSGIQFVSEEIKDVLFRDKHMGYQVFIKYWGVHHDRNEEPPPSERWTTRIKLEISTEEVILITPVHKIIDHSYSDHLISTSPVLCYTIDEIITEKLRALVQRKYTAPRDFFDLYQLTHDFKRVDWDRIKPIFIQKMEHRGFSYTGPQQLIDDTSETKALKAWGASLSHQITGKTLPSSQEIISEIRKRIAEYL